MAQTARAVRRVSPNSMALPVAAQAPVTTGAVDTQCGRHAAHVTPPAMHLVQEISALRPWLEGIMHSTIPGIRECCFCKTGWDLHFNQGALPPGSSETLYGPPSADPQVQRLLGLVEELSILVSSQIPAPGFAGRAAECFQFSLGGRRGPHADGSHLGGVIATVTIDGDGTVVLERADRRLGEDDSELHWRQRCGDWYAIWGRSRDKLPQPGWGRPIEHSVVAGSTVRLSLTLRFVREGHAANAARARDGPWTKGDKCFAQYRAYSKDAKGVMSAGEVVKVCESHSRVPFDSRTGATTLASAGVSCAARKANRTSSPSARPGSGGCGPATSGSGRTDCCRHGQGRGTRRSSTRGYRAGRRRGALNPTARMRWRCCARADRVRWRAALQLGRMEAARGSARRRGGVEGDTPGARGSECERGRGT